MTFDKYMSPMSDTQLKEACRRIRHVALDMDGTIYLGSQLFPWTKGFLQKLTDNGIGYSFLTNNPTRSLDDYVKKLRGMSIEATREEVYTTAVATIDYIKTHYPQARRLFVLGTPSMIGEFEAAGFHILHGEEAYRPILFYDIGAFVWFARIIEWEFPGFSVERCLDRLLDMQEEIETKGTVRGTIHRYLIAAQK